MRALTWILGLPLALLAAVFAVANRHDVRLELWPFPWVLDLPAYLAVLVPLAAGLLLGLLVAGVKGLRSGARVAAERRRAQALERQLEAARRELDAARAEAQAAALPPVAAPDQAA